MGLFGKNPFQKKESNGNSWGVILKGVPDKKTEEGLIRIFTERLDVPGDDALKIIRSVPIILFDERDPREAEQMKLILNQTGARTAISNDPNDFKKLPRVVWPKKVEAQDLGVEQAAAPPPPAPPFSRPATPAAPTQPSSSTPPPVFPKVPPTASSFPWGPPSRPVPETPPAPAPRAPAPPQPKPLFSPAPVPDDMRIKYENLQQSYLGAVDRLEKKDVELQAALEKVRSLEQETSSLSFQLERFQKASFEEKIAELETKVKVLTEQKDWGLKERDEWKDRSEGVEQELSKLQNLQAALEKEKEALEKERERLAQEKEQAVSAGQHLEKSLEGLRREFSESESLRESLQKEIAELQAEKERPISELEKIKGELQGQIDSITKQARPLQSQLESLEKVLATLRGSKKTEPKEKGRGRHFDV